MNSTIVINRKTPINLKDVSAIEALTPGEIDKLAERYQGDPNDFAMFTSAVRLVDGSTKLAVQSLEELRRLAKGRVLNMAQAGSANGKTLAGPLVPLEAIRHLEPISEEERENLDYMLATMDKLAERVETLESILTENYSDWRTADSAARRTQSRGADTKGENIDG